MKKSYFLSYVFHTLPFTDDSDASCNSYSNLLGNQVYCIGRRTLVSPRVRDNRPGNDVFYARQLRFQVVDVIDCHAVWRRRGTWEQNTLDDDSFKALMVDWLGNDMFYKGEKKVLTWESIILHICFGFAFLRDAIGLNWRIRATLSSNRW